MCVCMSVKLTVIVGLVWAVVLFVSALLIVGQAEQEQFFSRWEWEKYASNKHAKDFYTRDPLITNLKEVCHRCPSVRHCFLGVNACLTRCSIEWILISRMDLLACRLLFVVTAAFIIP